MNQIKKLTPGLWPEFTAYRDHRSKWAVVVFFVQKFRLKTLRYSS